MAKSTETAAGFLDERQDFLHVHAAPSVSGYGWDIVVRIDGTYTDQRDAEAVVEAVRYRLDHLSDMRWTDRPWWDGPPFEPQPRPRLVR